LLLALISTVNLVSAPVRIHYHIFVLSKLLTVLKWGLLFNERRGLTTIGHPLILGVTLLLDHNTQHPSLAHSTPA
jgi:hypothetical protein